MYNTYLKNKYGPKKVIDIYSTNNRIRRPTPQAERPIPPQAERPIPPQAELPNNITKEENHKSTMPGLNIKKEIIFANADDTAEIYKQSIEPTNSNINVPHVLLHTMLPKSCLGFACDFIRENHTDSLDKYLTYNPIGGEITYRDIPNHGPPTEMLEVRKLVADLTSQVDKLTIQINALNSIQEKNSGSILKS